MVPFFDAIPFDETDAAFVIGFAMAAAAAPPLDAEVEGKDGGTVNEAVDEADGIAVAVAAAAFVALPLAVVLALALAAGEVSDAGGTLMGGTVALNSGDGAAKLLPVPLDDVLKAEADMLDDMGGIEAGWPIPLVNGDGLAAAATWLYVFTSAVGSKPACSLAIILAVAAFGAPGRCRW